METHPSYTESLTQSLSFAAIIGGAVAFLFVIYFVIAFYEKKKNKKRPLLELTARFALPLGFLFSFFGMFMSFFYAEVLRFAPCDLCWFQRIFLYPQAFLFGYAWVKKDKGVFAYSLVLSTVGVAIGIYHHMLQIGYDLMKPCSNAPFAVDCAKPSFIEFGFVTFPLMSTVLFVWLIIVALAGVYYKK
jgi:disulfide bond formation protein DsbB